MCHPDKMQVRSDLGPAVALKAREGIFWAWEPSLSSAACRNPLLKLIDALTQWPRWLQSRHWLVLLLISRHPLLIPAFTNRRGSASTWGLLLGFLVSWAAIVVCSCLTLPSSKVRFRLWKMLDKCKNNRFNRSLRHDWESLI